MLFNSYEFILLFLPLSIAVYFWLNGKRLTAASKAWLVFASLFFYSWWNIVYLPLILGSILFNFSVGSAISKASGHKRKLSTKTLLAFGVTANILLLGYFKYVDFFISNINAVAGVHMDLLHIILPLGISFFTFTQIAYLVDAYRGEVKEMDYLNYTLFVTFFPHLLAGPILHHKEMMPQFDNIRNKVLNYRNISIGLFLFSIGLFKKVVVADTFAVWANAGFGSTQALSFFEAWATSLSYTFQLYFDFSGYTDMALGVALMFNIRLPINFNSPYKALDIQDFWRRWHITLSRFLRDYIYIPLGGNRLGEFRTYTNLFTVFLIGGLWHGASWMFVIWGAMHGTAIVLHRYWSENLKPKLKQTLGKSKEYTFGKWATVLAWVVTFNFINLTWIFFRAKDMDSAMNVLGGMVWGNMHMLGSGIFKNPTYEIIKWLAVSLLIVMIGKNSNQYLSVFRTNYKYLLILIAMFLYAMTKVSSKSEFIYYGF